MSETKTVGVRYCGGCNPRFDRVAAVNRLERACPQARFQSARPGRVYDLLLIVGGCPACCADQGGLVGREKAEIREEQDFRRVLPLLGGAVEDGT